MFASDACVSDTWLMFVYGVRFWCFCLMHEFRIAVWCAWLVQLYYARVPVTPVFCICLMQLSDEFVSCMCLMNMFHACARQACLVLV